ncbi:MAG: hypothetical protein HWE30_15770 [Methylocystaceae bacterium]|nr:hypothetical protein [Methylocystaceae bacterium]
MIELGLQFYFQNKTLNKYLQLNNDVVEFYETYHNKLHHLKYFEGHDSNYNDHKTDLLFKTIYDKELPETLLFQGDSWADQINHAEGVDLLLKQFGADNNLNVINAGIPSFAPSPMTVQLQVLRQDFNFKPTYVAAIIDQTDVGDELCRYASKLEKEANGHLIAVKPENIYSKEIFSTQRYLENQKIMRQDALGLTRLYHMLALRLDIREHKQKKRCGWNEIIRPIAKDISEEETRAFQETIQGYIDEVFAGNEVKHLFLISHPHRGHLDVFKDENYKNYTKALYESVVQSHEYSDKITLIDFSENFQQRYSSFNINEIFREDDRASHLSNTAYLKIFMPEILQNITNELSDE